MPRRDKLPENPTLKDINWFKKENNWGELPAFYHMVSSSIGELEGLLTHGFDNAFRRICNKHNWNLDRLDGYETSSGEIVVENSPRLAIYQAFTDWGFEVHAFPFAKDMEIDQYVKDHPAMEFKIWDPSSMRLLMRINQLGKFIIHCFEYKDPADKALVMYADKMTKKALGFLHRNVDIVAINGKGIGEYYQDIRNQIQEAQEMQEVVELRPNILNLTDIDLLRNDPERKD